MLMGGLLVAALLACLAARKWQKEAPSSRPVHPEISCSPMEISSTAQVEMGSTPDAWELNDAALEAARLEKAGAEETGASA